jgi:Mn-dependent DtxR family transcriptional regulator
MAELSKEEFEELRALPKEESKVLRGLIDRGPISDLELAASLSLLPSFVVTCVQRLEELGIVKVENAKIQLTPYGTEAAKLRRSLEKLDELGRARAAI